VYVTNRSANDLWVYDMDTTTGELTKLKGTVKAGTVPRDVAIDPTGRFAYVANEGFFHGELGTVSAYQIDASTGALTQVSGSPFASGRELYGVAIDPTGKFAYVIGEGDDKVYGYGIDSNNGGLTPLPDSPYASEKTPFYLAIDPTGKFAYTTNARYTGENHNRGHVSAYTIAANGVLTPVKDSPFGAGEHPRGVAIDPTHNLVFVTTQRQFGNGVDGVHAYFLRPSGALAQVKDSPFATGSLPEGIAIDASGKFAYVADSGSDDVSGYEINDTTGALTPLKRSPFKAGNAPQKVAIDPTGKFVYVTNSGSKDVWGYAIDPKSGDLTPVPESPFKAGGGAIGIAICRVEHGICKPPRL
jgi:6-phosphogluconolactonase (cycloisomerase 2 family)